MNETQFENYLFSAYLIGREQRRWSFKSWFDDNIKPNIRDLLNQEPPNDRTAIDLAKSLIEFDERKDCQFCSKYAWGEEKHDKDCPFAKAYKILSREDPQ